MKNIDTPSLLKEIEEFVTERDWDQFHSVKNLSMALSVEASELVEIFQWMSEENSNRIESDPETIQKVRDELADILFYLLRIAHKTDTDLEKALLEKLEKNQKKYPVEKARGISKKYTDL